MDRRDWIRKQLDGGGLLSLAGLLAAHLSVATLVGVSSGPALGAAVLLIPAAATAAAFEPVFRRGADARVLQGSALGALVACWTLAAVQCAMG